MRDAVAKFGSGLVNGQYIVAGKKAQISFQVLLKVLAEENNGDRPWHIPTKSALGVSR